MRGLTAATAIAVVFIFTGASFYIDPALISRGPVGRDLDPWPYIWCAFYIIGGLSFVVRHWFGPGAAEFGLYLLITGWALHGLGAIFAQGFGDVRVFGFFVWAAWGVGALRSER